MTTCVWGYFIVRNVVISGRLHFIYLFKIEDLGIHFCKGLLDSPKHINSQWKTLSMRQVPVAYYTEFYILLLVP